MKSGCAAWILAGGAHHTCFSQNLAAETIQDFAEMAGVEYVLIGKKTDLYQFRNELRWNEVYYQVNKH
jgi:L-arabinose isomerase